MSCTSQSEAGRHPAQQVPYDPLTIQYVVVQDIDEWLQGQFGYSVTDQ
jgi:hypothetical protein